jgi:hypothetical protein
VGNGYPSGSQDDDQYLPAMLREVLRRLDELESLDGSQIYNTVQDLRNLIDGLLEQVDGNFSGTLTVGGTSTLATINSLTTYSRNVTGSGSYRVMYVNLDGSIGYVPSSRLVKTDITSAEVDTDAILAIPLQHFRYKAAVEQMGDDAPLETGVIAETVDALGLGWLIDYSPDGAVEGFKYDRLALALLGVVQSMNARMEAAGI